MQHKRPLLAILAVFVFGACGHASSPTTVHLAGGGEEPSITVPLAFGDDATTTSSSAVPPLETTTTTRALPVTTSTVATPQPTTTTSTTIAHTANVSAVNHWSKTVQVDVQDETGHTWTLAPGGSGAAFTIENSFEHADGMSVTDHSTQCGYTNEGDYFQPGHEYLLEVIQDSLQCQPGVASPNLLIHDLTTNCTIGLRPGFLPRCG